MDSESATIRKYLKVYYLLGRLFAEGVRSVNEASRILSEPGTLKPPDVKLSVSPSTMNRINNEYCMNILRKALNKNILHLIAGDGST